MAEPLSWLEVAARSFEPEAGPRWSTPGELAKVLNPKTRQTPALDLVDQALVDAYTTPDARLIISMAPQEGKSVRVAGDFPVWWLVHRPDSRGVVASYGQKLADRNGRQIRRRIQENADALGIRIARDNGAVSDWTLADHEGGILSVGIGAGLTGRPADFLIIDDPIKDRKEADSETYRNGVWDWWTDTASARLAPGAPVILILTRWHFDDLAGRLLAAEDGHLWRVVNIPAQADHHPELGETDPLGREPGEFMLSARGRTTEQWERRKVTAGSRTWNALYQGRPSSESGDVWRRTWWRRYDTLLWTQHPTAPGAWTVDADEVILSWDMTFKDTKSSDYVVGQCWARKGANVYLLDQVHKRLSFTDTLTAFQAMAARWPQATAKLVEDKANGTAIIDQLRSKIPGIVPVTPTESKNARANGVAPFIEAGNVHLPKPDVALGGWDVEGLIDEAAAFPNGAHDDQVDATSQALARLLLKPSTFSTWMTWLDQQTT